MSDISEILKSITESYRERLSTPFFRNFLFGFFLFNWRGFFYLITSDERTLDKIYYFDLKYCDWNHMIWYPLIYSVLFTLIFHLIAWGFDFPIYFFQKRRKIKRNKFIAANIDSRKYIEESKIKLEERKKELMNLKNVNEEIERLNDDLKISNDTISKLKNDFSNLNSNLNEAIQEKGNLINENNTLKINQSNFVNNVGQIAFAELIENDLIFITNPEIDNINKILQKDYSVLNDILINPDVFYKNIIRSSMKYRNKPYATHLLDFLFENGFLYNSDLNSNITKIKLTAKGELLKKNVSKI